MTYNHFDHEQQIMKCWQIIDQLDTVNEGILEHNWSSDQVSNALIGLKEIYQLEFDKLFLQFEESIKPNADQ